MNEREKLKAEIEKTERKLERLKTQLHEAQVSELLPVGTLVWVKGKITDVDSKDPSYPYRIQFHDQFEWVTAGTKIIKCEED